MMFTQALLCVAVAGSLQLGTVTVEPHPSVPEGTSLQGLMSGTNGPNGDIYVVFRMTGSSSSRYLGVLDVETLSIAPIMELPGGTFAVKWDVRVPTDTVL